MIKSILVHIPTERPIRPVIDASISLAQQFGAELVALSLGYISTGPFIVEGAAATVLAANLDLEQRRAAERTAAALTVFDVAARNAGLPYRSRSIEGIPADAADAIGAAARLMICQSFCNRILIITHLTTRSLGTSFCRPADRCFSFLTFSTGLSSPNALGSAGTEIGLHREPFVMPILFSPGPTTSARFRSTQPTLHRPRRRSRS